MHAKVAGLYSRECLDAELQSVTHGVYSNSCYFMMTGSTVVT